MIESDVARVGIVVALEREARMLTRSQIKNELPVPLHAGSWLCVSGIGVKRAKRAALALIKCDCRVLVSWGMVGALNPSLKPGQLFLPEAIYTESGVIYTVDKPWHIYLQRLFEANIEIALGNLMTVDRVITSVSEKNDLRIHYPVAAVDMEAGAVAEVAADHNLPFIAIKAPVDMADQKLPLWLIRSLDPWGRIVKRNLLRNILRITFSDGPLLRQLSVNFQCSQKTLAWIARKTDCLSLQSIGNIGLGVKNHKVAQDDSNPGTR
ncbi:MAG: phosphorylase family protein [Gammaproteobacteria bacterium]